MADEGLYIHNGNGFVRQNSGACKRQGNGSECEIYAFNGGAFKIYPREQSTSISPGSNGGIGFYTVRQNYSNTYSNKAMQGYYGGYSSTGSSGQSIGHIYWRGGKPHINNLIRVDRVRFSIGRNVHTGWYNNYITGYLRMSNISNSGSYSQCIGTVQGSPQFTFSWAPYNQTTTIDYNGDLNNFMYRFLTDSRYQALCLYTGETYGNKPYNGEYYSANYAGTNNVSIEIWATYQP